MKEVENKTLLNLTLIATHVEIILDRVRVWTASEWR